MQRMVLYVLLSILVSACGFHLRSHYDVPAFLQEINLRAPSAYHEFSREMRLALEQRHISPQGGDVLLDIVNENLTRQTSTVDSNARAAEYTLIYTVDFRISLSDGSLTGPLQSLILRRSYQYSTNSVVGKNIEEEMLVQELRRDASQQIARQVAALKAMPALPVEESAP